MSVEEKESGHLSLATLAEIEEEILFYSSIVILDAINFLPAEYHELH
jgi:hypothetical protein